MLLTIGWISSSQKIQFLANQDKESWTELEIWKDSTYTAADTGS